MVFIQGAITLVMKMFNDVYLILPVIFEMPVCLCKSIRSWCLMNQSAYIRPCIVSPLDQVWLSSRQRHEMNQCWFAASQIPLIARFMGPTWGPPGANRTQMGSMLAPWTLLSGLYQWYLKQNTVVCSFQMHKISSAKIDHSRSQCINGQYS